MPEEYKVLDIFAGEISPGTEGWSIILLRPDGSRFQHTFPKETFEWRAAEYGLTDPAEILDTILHEPYQVVNEPSQIALPPSVKGAPSKKVSVTSEVESHSPSLYEAVSTAEAQAAHRSRIKAVKAEKIKVMDPEGLLSHIHGNHGMSSEKIRLKQEVVDLHRWTKLYGVIPIAEKTIELPKSAKLRDQFGKKI